MKQEVDLVWLKVVAEHIVHYNVKSATKYLSPKLVIRATWHNKPSKRNNRETMVVTFGQPNYLERAFVKLAKKAGEPFPIKKVQLRAWPKKRKAK